MAGGNYTLGNINKEGGICVDQAYFASIAGKARCLPTLYFFGQATARTRVVRLHESATTGIRLRSLHQPKTTSLAETPTRKQWTPISDHQLAFSPNIFTTAPNTLPREDERHHGRHFRIAR